MPFINDGQLVALGVAAPARLKSLPNVPTLAEQGIPNVEASNWYGVFAPKGASPEVVAKLNEAVRNSLKANALIANLASLGVEPSPSSPEAFRDLVQKTPQNGRRSSRRATSSRIGRSQSPHAARPTRGALCIPVIRRRSRVVSDSSILDDLGPAALFLLHVFTEPGGRSHSGD